MGYIPFRALVSSIVYFIGVNIDPVFAYDTSLILNLYHSCNH